MTMERLQAKDGTPKYLRAMRVHERTTSRFENTKKIGAQMKPLRLELAGAAQDYSDATDAQVDATADAQLADAITDDHIRAAHNAAKTVDLSDPTAGAVHALFPDGFAGSIAPTGLEQAKEANRIADAAERFPALKSHVTVLRQDAKDVTAAEAAQTKAFEKTGEARGKVVRLKTKVREQFEASYGALRVLFKSNPKVAERFFLASRRSPRAGEPVDPVDPADPADGV